MITYLSFGAGVNTVAILHIPDVMKIVDFVIFADTGGEKPETYAYIEKYVKPYLKEIGKDFVVVKGKERINGQEISNLYDACYLWKVIPSRMLRFCTDKFKIKPIKQYFQINFPGEKVRAVIGIAYDEAHRINNIRWDGQEIWYPLVEKKITRQGCIDIIKNAGWEIPLKSGCFFCPFQSKKEWFDLKNNHPELWQKAIELEKNGSRYPELLLWKEPLEKIDKKYITLEKYDEKHDVEECGGVCFL
jgi:3'-phosphoadenosine 5'-phosphosulfate sulfotransferase (PAPS reductase)/FAD synthetase